MSYRVIIQVDAIETRRERYLRDPLPIRLGGLAANLARVKSFSDHPAHSEAVRDLLDESRYFIEWTAADAELPLQVELVELQRLLARWRIKWDEIWNVLETRSAVAGQAAAWSQKVLERSGLLNAANL